jgi:hypothetical protein
MRAGFGGNYGPGVESPHSGGEDASDFAAAFVGR